MSLIQFEKQDSIGILTFNDPGKLNAMGPEMAAAFATKLDEIATDESLNVLVITGAGRAFSAGGDLQMLLDIGEMEHQQGAATLKAFYKNFLKLRDLKIPVIAAINGHAIGAGFCVALACDLRYVSKDAKLGANFAKIGISPGMGGTYFLKHMVGSLRTSEILLTGKIFSGKDAERFGLVNESTASDKLLPHALTVAQVIADNGKLAVRKIKQALQIAEHATLEEIFDWDSEAQAECLRTDDFKERIAGVLKK